MLSCFSCVWLFATLWTIAHQAPLSIGPSRQEYRSWLPCPAPGDLHNPGTEPKSPASPVLQVDSLLSETPGKPCPNSASVFTRKLSHGIWLGTSYVKCASTNTMCPLPHLVRQEVFKQVRDAILTKGVMIIISILTPYFLKSINFLLKDNCFVESCCFLSNLNMNQP